MKKIAFALLVATVAAPAFCQIGDESGVTKKYRASLGFYTIGSANSLDNAIISTSGLEQSGISFKFDIVTSRPTRHETLISYQYFNNVLEMGAGSMIYGEYRWRFDKFGRAYYGMNLGLWRLHESGSTTKTVSGSALGYHTSADTFVEFRYSQLETDANFTSIMFGKRF